MTAHHPSFPVFFLCATLILSMDGCMKTIPVEDITATTTIATCCPSLANLNTPFPGPAFTFPIAYSVQPNVGCTTAGCTNTVICPCPSAGACYLTIGNNLDTPSPDTSPLAYPSTVVPITSPTITCTPSCTYSIAADPFYGAGGPFTQINCNAS